MDPLQIDLKREYRVSRIDYIWGGPRSSTQLLGTIAISLSRADFAGDGSQDPGKLSTLIKTDDNLETRNLVRFQWPESFSKPTRYIRIQQVEDSDDSDWSSWRGLRIRHIKVFTATVKC